MQNLKLKAPDKTNLTYTYIYSDLSSHERIHQITDNWLKMCLRTDYRQIHIYKDPILEQHVIRVAHEHNSPIQEDIQDLEQQLTYQH